MANTAPSTVAICLGSPVYMWCVCVCVCVCVCEKESWVCYLQHVKPEGENDRCSSEHSRVWIYIECMCVCGM